MKRQTYLSNALSAADNKAKYDAEVKKNFGSQSYIGMDYEIE